MAFPATYFFGKLRYIREVYRLALAYPAGRWRRSANNGRGVKILRLYEDLGIKSVWLTPHIMEDMPNTTANLRERFSELLANYRGNEELHLRRKICLITLSRNRWNGMSCCHWARMATTCWWKFLISVLRWDWAISCFTSRPKVIIQPSPILNGMSI